MLEAGRFMPSEKTTRRLPRKVYGKRCQNTSRQGSLTNRGRRIAGSRRKGQYQKNGVFFHRIRSCDAAQFPLFSGPLLAGFHLANTNETGRTTFSRRERLWLAAAGVGLLGLLALAALLCPSPLGHGTHRQLGLPPCTFLVLFGRPCPTCGMTTAWAHLAQGQWGDAARANLGGALLGLGAVAAVPWLIGSALRGAWLGVLPNRAAAAWILTTLLLVTLIDWFIRLSLG